MEENFNEWVARSASANMSDADIGAAVGLDEATLDLVSRCAQALKLW